MPVTVEVRFKGNRKDYFLWPEDAPRLSLQQPVIVEADRGLDFGRVGVFGETAEKKCAAGCGGCAVGGDVPKATQRVVRTASQEDIRTANDLRRSEEPTRIKAVERVRHHRLEMKLADVEWQWDRKKLSCYFTAEKRVDFRDLVRDLATTFKTRIELRQIGVRDEAARLGGVGRCGKEYCCSTWLKSLDPISLSLAKDQHLSLNPSQISGGCGRLLCCLKYEHEFYVASRKRFPKEGKLVPTRAGTEKVVAVDIFRERVFLRGEAGPRIVQLADLREEMALAATASPDAPPAAGPPAADAASSRPPRSERPAARREPRQRDGEPARPERRGRDRDRPRRQGPLKSDQASGRGAPESNAPAPPAGAPATTDGPGRPVEADGTPETRRSKGRNKRRRRRRGKGPGSDGPSSPPGRDQ